MLPKQAAIAWQKISSVLMERWLRIQTTGQVAPPTSEGIHYTPLPYVMISRMFRLLNLGPDDVFIDVGCGKGRVLCCAARLPIKRVVGIELNNDLVILAKNNVKQLRGVQAKVEIVNISAEKFPYDEATVVYLYNPFNARITELVMDTVRASYQRKPRRIRVVYANPVHEEAMRKNGWLKKTEEWPATDFPGFGYPVSFWETTGGN